MKRLQGHILPSVASKMIWFLLYWSLLMRASHSLDTLNQGAVFNSSHLLTSRNGFFTLGFSGGYLVINYTNDNIPHPVWSANRNNPMLESSLTIDEFGNFKIANSSGDSFEIYSAKSASLPAATNMGAVLGDDGNFVLKQNENILWQSFDHPTDTLLPGMKLGIDTKNGKNWKLTSWLRDDNPIEGAFTMEWDPTERQMIVKRRGIRFWTSGLLTPENNFENVPLPDSFNHNYNFSVDGDSVSYSLLVDEGKLNGLRSNISRWFLNYKGDIQDGQGRALILSSNNCDGNNTQWGCEKWEGPQCRKDGDKYRLSGGNFLAKYVTRDYGKNLNFIDCKDMCWQNCSCTAFNSNNNGDGGTVCEFYSGNYEGEASSDEQLSGQTLMYSIIPGPPPPPSDKKWIWIVTILSVVLIFILASMFWYSRWRKLKQEEKFLKELLTSDRPDDSSELEDGENRNQRLKLYSVALIKAATNSFSSENKLGEGGFGPVYKGRLAEGVEIAVKRLSRSSGQGLVEFKNELLLIAKLQHTNLVRLLGFCIQGEERLLVYEYLPNKSLDFFIFGDQSKRELLDWNKRFNIIEGIAQGLLYLHKYSRLRIIHRDLKASNILLDRDMNPKISDFGMARIFKANENEANTHRIVGTYGYMSPEYAMSGIFSVKSDVYSFGVLLLEIVSGKKNHNVYDYDRMLNLIGYAWDLWKRDEALELVDQTLRGAAQKEQVLRCINVGLLCVEQIPFDRPDMSDVLSMLTNEVRVELPIPKEPAFFVGQRRTLPSLSSVQEEVPSANGLSITEMDGR